jgi:hypothetical protein
MNHSQHGVKNDFKAITDGTQRPHGIIPHANMWHLRRLLVGVLVAACAAWDHSGAASARTVPVNNVRGMQPRC